ncbi:HSF-type DNA-binding [Fragilaria crotonensis]|nr:HSF-type DNA-binding [Fragilaria crotonensis]
MPMSNSSILHDSPLNDAAPSSSKDGSVPSGFILKLYQMVNGAPDDVISWTANGDAFKIGADLNRLESETLPQYFRHSRFQSLVRQLNFYNFRKVNRERTFWIYKHRLFHRDHPEGLHLLRRRTCPGVDGRKNRFSNYSRKAGDDAGVGDEGYDEESKSSDESAYEIEVAEPKSKEEYHSFIGSDDAKVSQLDVVDEPDCSSEKEVDERVARREQAHVVSQVALKLEEYARKAKRSRGGTRYGVGIVTPPLGGSQSYRSVLTYDDEYDAMAARVTSAVVTVAPGVESHATDDKLLPAPITPNPSRPMMVICDENPVGNIDLAKLVYDQIMDGDRDYASKAASAAVAYFCTASSPNEQEGEACAKILGIMSGNDKLAHEFMQYRYALHPVDCSSTLSNSTFCAPGLRNDITAFSLDQIWERAASRRDALRDFKTFAVNYMNAEIARMEYRGEETGALRRTAEVWLRSASTHA